MQKDLPIVNMYASLAYSTGKSQLSSIKIHILRLFLQFSIEKSAQWAAFCADNRPKPKKMGGVLFWVDTY
jgi:hypothetical protein